MGDSGDMNRQGGGGAVLIMGTGSCRPWCEHYSRVAPDTLIHPTPASESATTAHLSNFHNIAVPVKGKISPGVYSRSSLPHPQSESENLTRRLPTYLEPNANARALVPFRCRRTLLATARRMG